jgi:Icc-related predicted phosphoesterase
MRIHAGSAAVRAFLEEHDVSLCLCGHIHEARGEARVGPARCVNLGAFKSGRYALVDIRAGAEPGIEITWRSL